MKKQKKRGVQLTGFSIMEILALFISSIYRWLDSILRDHNKEKSICVKIKVKGERLQVNTQKTLYHGSAKLLRHEKETEL